MCSTLWILEVSLPHRAIGMRNTRLRESSVISRVKAHGLPVHVAPTLAVVRLRLDGSGANPPRVMIRYGRIHL